MLVVTAVGCHGGKSGNEVGNSQQVHWQTLGGRGSQASQAIYEEACWIILMYCIWFPCEPVLIGINCTDITKT